ncbi:MAG TPA: DUF948 domain-containing protein [Geobacteraceae bacterium]
MDVISIAVVVVAVTIVILAVFAIPAFIEARKTAVAAREFLAHTDTELQPALKNLHLIIHDLKEMTAEAAEKTGDVKLFMEALGDTGRNLRTINAVVGAVAGVLSTSSLWITGAKAAGRLIRNRFSKKGEK